MVASAKSYDSISNTDNNNNNAANNVNACTTSDESSWLFSGGSRQDVRRSPSSSSRSPFAVMAAGFLVAVVLLAFTTNRNGGQQQLASLQELRNDGGDQTLLWGRSRETGVGAGVTTVDDDHSDDDSGHTHTRTRTFEADDDGDAISDSASDGSSGSSGSDSDSDLTPKHHSSSKPPKCSFLDCWAAKCSWDLAPFVCLRHNGGPHMGCSSDPWEPETCDEQCDLSTCDGMEVPEADDKEYSCKHEPCPEEWCCGGQVCGSSMSYQCLSGSARFGCHDDPLEWTIKVDDATCSQCCDTRTCSDFNATVCETFVASKAAAAVAETQETKMESSAAAASSIGVFGFTLATVAVMLLSVTL